MGTTPASALAPAVTPALAPAIVPDFIPALTPDFVPALAPALAPAITSPSLHYHFTITGTSTDLRIQSVLITIVYPDLISCPL